MRPIIRSLLVLVVLGAGVLAYARPAVADPGIGSDAAFPIGGAAANTVLEPVAGAPVLGPLVPPPATRITSLISPPNPPAFGETEDISYGDETILLGPLFLEFSVGVTAGGAMSTGHPGTPLVAPPAFTLANESGLIAPVGDGATMADVYISAGPLFGPPPCGPIGPNFQILDDDGAGPISPRLGLNMPPGPGVGPGASNLDAYDRTEEVPLVRPAPATGGAPVPATGIIFFTIDGPTAAGWAGGPIPAPGGGVALPTASDILAWNPAIGGPVIYATAGALGLLAGPDNVDALAVTRMPPAPPLPPFGPGFDFEPPGTAVIAFSLAPGSPSLSPTSGGAAATPLAPPCFPPGTGTAGDTWFVAGPVPVGGAAPYIHAEALGLNTIRSGGFADDNLDALDLCNGFMGSDIDGDFIDDACDFDKDGDGTGNFIDPDDDGDGFGDPQQTLHLGPANTVAAMDNCPMVPNPGQANADGNFVDTSPPYVMAIDDKTWPFTDAFGDACDTDDDNDGILDAVETGGPPCASASAATLPLVRDSDGDRALDGAECSLGTDPAIAASVPALAACGAAGDADGDKVSNRVEFCYYGSSTGSTDSDGDLALDGAKDGCEVGSINADRIVNSLDQGKLALGIISLGYHVGSDLNKDGVLNSIDQGLMAQYIVPPGQCP